jgi:hypothetical protein
MDSDSQPPPAYTPAVSAAADQSQQPTSPLVLRRHKSTFGLLLFFLPLLLIPWVVTCVLDVRPLYGASSYLTQTSSFDEKAAQDVGKWYRAVQVLIVVAAVLTLPIVSAVLSHAAVIIIQRHRPTQQLNAMELLSLADAPWSRLGFDRNGPRFVYGASALILVGELSEYCCLECAVTKLTITHRPSATHSPVSFSCSGAAHCGHLSRCPRS